MVNRQRFLLDDLDSEGFPLRYTTMHANQIEDERMNVVVAALNLGKTLDHAVPQALLADHKCMRCANPLGWEDVNGVVLPRITWAERVGNCTEPKCVLYGTVKCEPGSGCMCDGEVR